MTQFVSSAFPIGSVVTMRDPQPWQPPVGTIGTVIDNAKHSATLVVRWEKGGRQAVSSSRVIKQ